MLHTYNITKKKEIPQINAYVQKNQDREINKESDLGSNIQKFYI